MRELRHRSKADRFEESFVEDEIYFWGVYLDDISLLGEQNIHRKWVGVEDADTNELLGSATSNSAYTKVMMMLLKSGLNLDKLILSHNNTVADFFENKATQNRTY